MNIEQIASDLCEAGKTALNSGNAEGAIKFFCQSLSYASRPETLLLKEKAETLHAEHVARQEMENRDPAVIAKREKALAAGKKAVRKFTKENKLPSAGMRLKPTNNNAGTNSCIGGIPMVPTDFEWPIRQSGQQLHFLCQINLGELEKIAFSVEGLPAEGMLSFFYDLVDQPWGDGDEQDAWRVYLFPDLLQLVPAKDPETCNLNPASIRWKRKESYPDPMSDEAINSLSVEAQKAYQEFCFGDYGEDPCHRLMGYPKLVQSDVRYECEWASRKLTAKLLEEIGEQQLQSDSRDWRLLLQLDSDETLDMYWGDCGSLYFCIKEESLRRCDFSKVWLRLQSH